MDPTLPNTSVQSPPTPQPVTNTPTQPAPVNSSGSSKKRKIIIVIGILLLLGLVLAGLYAFKIIPAPLNQSAPINTQPKLPPTTGLEAAKRTAKFLDKTVKTDGSFHLSYKCDLKAADPCTTSDTSVVPFPSSLILAYYDLYDAIQDSAYKQKADNAVNFYFNECQQNNKNCSGNIFAFHAYYLISKDEKYKDIVLKTAGQGIEEGKPLKTYIDANNTGHRLLILFELSRDNKYLDQFGKLAKDTLDGQLNSDPDNSVLYTVNSQQSNGQVKEKDLPLAWDIYLPAYKITKNKTYLTATQNIVKNLTSDSDKLISHLGINPALRTVEILLDLSESSDVTQEEAITYKQQAREITQKIMKYFWDIPENKRFNADEGFVIDRNQTIQSTSKESYSSAMMIRNLLRMRGEKFSF